MKVTASCYPPGIMVKQEVINAIRKGLISWFNSTLDSESLEPLLMRKECLNGAECREILDKVNTMLIDINAHLESGTRHYNALFEKTLGINFNSIIYKQYDKMVC